MPVIQKSWLVSETEERTLYSVITMLRTGQAITHTQRLEILEKFMPLQVYLFDKYGKPEILKSEDILK